MSWNHVELTTLVHDWVQHEVLMKEERRIQRGVKRAKWKMKSRRRIGQTKRVLTTLSLPTVTAECSSLFSLSFPSCSPPVCLCSPLSPVLKESWFYFSSVHHRYAMLFLSISLKWQPDRWCQNPSETTVRCCLHLFPVCRCRFMFAYACVRYSQPSVRDVVLACIEEGSRRVESL